MEATFESITINTAGKPNVSESHEKLVSLTFLYPDGTTKQIQAKAGENFLMLAKKNHLQIEGACGGVLACSTCHVIINDPWFDLLPQATVKEERMLDNAQEVELNSRLCCQLMVTPDMDGITIKIPSSTISTDDHDH